MWKTSALILYDLNFSARREFPVLLQFLSNTIAANSMLQYCIKWLRIWIFGALDMSKIGNFHIILQIWQKMMKNAPNCANVGVYTEGVSISRKLKSHQNRSKHVQTCIGTHIIRFGGVH